MMFTTEMNEYNLQHPFFVLVKIVPFQYPSVQIATGKYDHSNRVNDKMKFKVKREEQQQKVKRFQLFKIYIYLSSARMTMCVLSSSPC